MNTDAHPISLDASKRPPMSDLGQRLFDMCNSMNRARMAELGITNHNGDHIRAHAEVESDGARSPIVPKLRFRELEVSDEHVEYMFMLVTQDCLAKRTRGVTDYVALEMLGSLTALVKA